MILAAMFMAAALDDSQPAQVQSVDAPRRADQPALPKLLQKILATGDGKTPETAYRVHSVGQEYAILRALGVEVRQQSLVVQDRAYDVLTAWDPNANAEKQIWFDISKFYPLF